MVKTFGILYNSLHTQLLNKFGENSIITRKEFFCKLGKHYMVPKDLKEGVLREMEEMNMISRINRDSIKILHNNFGYGIVLETEKECYNSVVEAIHPFTKE